MLKPIINSLKRIISIKPCKILNIYDYGKIEAYYCGKIATHGTKIKENRDFSAF